uniref:Uncharacterized protein n=1 Tax=Knipowitschia caucasica TaxID=637954 RepID=A0AAV2M505_KNICA
MTFITGALDRALSSGQALSGDLLSQARTTSAATLRMEAERRQLLDLPTSQMSLFGPDMQAWVARLESAAKDSARLAPHLAPRREAHQPLRSRDRGRERWPGRHPDPYPRSVIHRPPLDEAPGSRQTHGWLAGATHPPPTSLW